MASQGHRVTRMRWGNSRASTQASAFDHLCVVCRETVKGSEIELEDGPFDTGLGS
jgi:hypothetical protein